jgi:hypothetical protein
MCLTFSFPVRNMVSTESIFETISIGKEEEVKDKNKCM